MRIDSDPQNWGFEVLGPAPWTPKVVPFFLGTPCKDHCKCSLGDLFRENL